MRAKRRAFNETSTTVCSHREAQPVGGALRGLHDDVHPEVESLPLRGMFHRLLLKPLNQLQVLHHRAQIPGDEKEKVSIGNIM